MSVIRDIRKDMGDSIPQYYGDSRVVANILDREAAEIEALNAEVKAVLDQFFIDTATYGLARWEKICGIPTDELKPIEQRRSVVKSKIRGVGTVTVELIKNVAKAYANGEVDVTEDPGNYTIKVTFIGTRGTPPNLQDIQNALREIIPAHLAVNFQFTYLRWEELDGYGLTWDALDVKRLTWDQFEIYKQ